MKTVAAVEMLSGRNEQLNFRSTHRSDDPAHVIEDLLFFCDPFDHRLELAALAEEIVVGIDEQ